jgi:hypothetical protein
MKLFETSFAIAEGMPASVALNWNNLAAGPSVGENDFGQNPEATLAAMDAGLTAAGVPLDEGTPLPAGGTIYQHDKVVAIEAIGTGKRGIWAHRNSQGSSAVDPVDDRNWTERSLDANGTALLETSVRMRTDRFGRRAAITTITSPTRSVQIVNDATASELEGAGERSLTLALSTRFAYAAAGKNRHALAHPSEARLQREVQTLLQQNQTSREYNLQGESCRAAFLAELERRLLAESQRTFAADMAVVLALGAAILQDTGLAKELKIEGFNPAGLEPSSTFSVAHNAENAQYGAIMALTPQIFHLGIELSIANESELAAGTTLTPLVTLQTRNNLPKNKNTVSVVRCLASSSGY